MRRFLKFQKLLNQYKPNVPFVGHRQTEQTQIRHSILLGLIRVSTVCLRKILLKFRKIKKWKLTPNYPENRTGLVQLIKLGKYIWLQWVKIIDERDEPLPEISNNVVHCMCNQQGLRPACAYAQSDQSIY